MLETIEEFCKTHEHTIAAIEAISTLAAVIISLTLAHRATIANRTQLVARLMITTLSMPNSPVQVGPKFIVASIRNIGILPCQIQLGFLCWKPPFRGFIYELDPTAANAYISHIGWR